MKLEHPVSDYLIFLLYVMEYYKDKLDDFIKHTMSFPLREIEIPAERLEVLEG